MMKKIFTIAAVCVSMLGANAQTTVQGSKFFDNWSIGLDGGVQTNLHDWNAPQGAVAGLTLNKEITPVYGLSFDAYMGINNTGNWLHHPTHFHNGTAIDNAAFSTYGRVNLMNLFAGYKGRPRVFEIEGLAGVGYAHAYNNDNVAPVSGADVLFAKTGANLNFNLGEKRAWSLNVRPAVIWNLSGGQFDSRKAVGQLTAGVTYHFGNSNGEHYFTKAVVRNQSEIDALNAAVNAARAREAQERENSSRALDAKDREINDLKKALNDCQNRAPKEVVKVSTEQSMECYVYFGQGKSAIDASQMPNVERIATFLKSHKAAKVVVNGYASPEGSKEINERLAQQRAEAVKTALVNKYKIAASRIEAKGKGVGEAFSEPDWNRVSICTIHE